jgi:large subunit ribosomal protein L19
MSSKLIEFNKKQIKTDMPDIKAGMQIRVHEKIKEGDRDRIQVFEGVVLARKHGKGINATITVRSVVAGVGVEKVWPIHSPKIAKIEILRTPTVRRSKLYFLRELSPKKTRKKLSVFKNIIAPKAEPISVVEELEESEVKE